MRGACPLSTLPVMGYLSFRKSISAVDVLLQADKAYCSLTKKAAFGAQHNRQTGTFRLYRAGRRVRHDAFPLRGKAERELPRRKTGLAACGRRHTNGYNDTPALNALKALRGAPISMGRGETPVRLQLTTARFCLLMNTVYPYRKRRFFLMDKNQTVITERKIGKITYLVQALPSEKATDTIHKKIEKLIVKDLQKKPGNPGFLASE